MNAMLPPRRLVGDIHRIAERGGVVAHGDAAELTAAIGLAFHGKPGLVDNLRRSIASLKRRQRQMLDDWRGRYRPIETAAPKSPAAEFLDQIARRMSVEGYPVRRRYALMICRQIRQRIGRARLALKLFDEGNLP